MKKNRRRSEWHQVTNSEAHHITGSTMTPDQVYEYPVEELPTQLQKLPGLYAAYVTSYATSSISPEGVSVQGEVAAVRGDEAMGKSYVYLFGVSGSGVFFNGPYTNFDAHHFQDTGSIPVDKLFGNVPRQ